MSLETDAIQFDAEEAPISLPFPTAPWGRILYGLFVTALPIFSFWATDLLKPEWQNGELSSYIILLLFPEASLWLFPLLLYSIVCYLLLLYMPTRFAQAFVIRSGIYTGVVLALQYSITLLLYIIADWLSYTIFIAWFFPLYFPRIYQWLVNKLGKKETIALLVSLLAIVFLIFIAVSRQAFTPLLLILVILIAATPFWSFLMAGRAAVWLFKNYESKFTLVHGLGAIAWLASYIAALRYDILKMYELYAQLPTQPPDCYTATAAAQGHTKLVRSWTVQLADGKSMRVNEQLQTLKCAELALMAVAPRVHKFVRKIYDVGGKRLAREIRNPLMADFAYLLLKPFEWMAKFCLRFIIGNVRSRSIGMYSK